MSVGVEERQSVAVYRYLDIAGLAGLEEHFGKALEFLGRTAHAAFVVGYIELHHLGTGHVSAVGDRHGEGHGAIFCLRAVGCHLAECEVGIAQPMPEGEEGLDFLGVMPAVSNEYALLVFEVPHVAVSTFHTRICTQRMCRTVREPDGECEGKLARWIDLAEEYVGYRVSGFRAEEPCLNDCGNILYPRHGHGVAAYVDHHEIGVGCREGAYNVVLSIGQFKSGTVAVLAVLSGTLVETTHENHIVCLAGFAHGLGDKLGRTA